MTHAFILNYMVEQQSGQLDAVFRALADPTRRTMLQQLAERDHTISQLAEPFDMSLAAASKHIKVLERAGLVRRTVRGRTHICQLAPEPLASAHDWLHFYERFWRDRLDALERALNTPEDSYGGRGDDAE